MKSCTILTGGQHPEYGCI